MIDYLELLLDEQEEDQTATEPDWFASEWTVPPVEEQTPGRMTERTEGAQGTEERPAAARAEDVLTAETDAPERRAADTLAASAENAFMAETSGAPEVETAESRRALVWEMEKAGERGLAGGAGGFALPVLTDGKGEPAGEAGESGYALNWSIAAGSAEKSASGAAWLYRQVRQGAVQAGYTRREATLVPVPAAVERTERDTLRPEALDRVFQRDARRYDTGFTLF